MFSLVLRLCLLTLFCSQAVVAREETRVNVGIYQNEPKIFLNAEGRPDGFLPNCWTRWRTGKLGP